MTLVELVPPMIAANVVFAFYALVVYRFHVRETPGKESLSYLGWLGIIIVAVGAFFYFQRHEIVSGFVATFMATITGLMFAAVIVNGIVQGVKHLRKSAE